jgi:hypothetical protein
MYVGDALSNSVIWFDIDNLKAREKAVYEICKAVNFSSNDTAFPLPAFKKLNRCSEKGRISSGPMSKRPMRRVAWFYEDCSLDQNGTSKIETAVRRIFMELMKEQMTMR